MLILAVPMCSCLFITISLLSPTRYPGTVLRYLGADLVLWAQLYSAFLELVSRAYLFDLHSV